MILDLEVIKKGNEVGVRIGNPQNYDGTNPPNNAGNHSGNPTPSPAARPAPQPLEHCNYWKKD